MKHHKAQRTLGRTRRGRTALVRGLACSLIEHGRITTTEAKAKELRPFVERLVTHAKKSTLAGRRTIIARLGGSSEDHAKKLVDVLAPKYKDREGGYTRIVKLPPRKGDASPMAIIEFVS